jgi:Dna[CI] antecedent, DciA
MDDENENVQSDSTDFLEERLRDDSLSEAEAFHQFSDQLTRRQRYRKTPPSAKDLVNRLFAARGYGQLQSKEDLQSHWTNAVGVKWEKQTRVGQLRRGVLEVFCSNSILCQELMFQKQKLIRSLRAHPSLNQLKDLKFRVGAMDAES